VGWLILLPTGIGNSKYRQIDAEKIYLGILHPGKKAYSMQEMALSGAAKFKP